MNEETVMPDVSTECGITEREGGGMTKLLNNSRPLLPDPFLTEERQLFFNSIDRKLPDGSMARDVKSPDRDDALRFRDTALPHLDDVYTLARYLLRNPADAEDAAQECFLRAYRHFSTFQGGPIKPWLMAILRNVCRDGYSRHKKPEVRHGDSFPYDNDCVQPLWQEPSTTPEIDMLRSLDVQTVRRLITALPEPFREVLILRELNDHSYREIADVVGTPIGTVMSRIARARSMLRKAWSVEGNGRSNKLRQSRTIAARHPRRRPLNRMWRIGGKSSAYTNRE
jgi:RNA polymerase sigma-70 factor (ECF subfamily)